MEKEILDKEGLLTYDRKIKEVISQQSINIIEKDNYLQFPSIGDKNILYLDIENNSCYRWDDSEMKYFCIGKNYDDIEVISGGSSAIDNN